MQTPFRNLELRTPAPERGKVLQGRTREPVNRQAARVFSQSPWWTKPLPPPAEFTLNALRKERDDMKAERDGARALLAVERGRNGRLQKMCEKRQAENAALLKELEALRREVEGALRRLKEVTS